MSVAAADSPRQTHGLVPLATLVVSLIALALVTVACSSTTTVGVRTGDSTDLADLADLADAVGDDPAADGAAPGAGAVDTGAGGDGAVASARAAADSAAADSAAPAGEGEAPPGEFDEFEASPGYLAFAAQQVEAAESFQFEAFHQITGSSTVDLGSRDVPVATGAASGDRVRADADLTAMLESVPLLDLADRSGLSMHMVIDGTDMYMHMPIFALVAEMGGELPPEMSWLEVPATGWGRIDLTRLSDDTVLAEMGMGKVVDAREMLAMLDDLGTVVDGGFGEVRGVPTRVLNATVDLQESSGLAEAAAAGVLSDEIGWLALMQIEVHVDDASRVRRVTTIIDVGPSARADVGQSEMTTWMRADFFAFDEPVEVDVPVGAVDITDELLQLHGG